MISNVSAYIAGGDLYIFMNIYDIAKNAGVSIATVSRVINGSGPVSGKTRQEVERVMGELGYQPNVMARGLMTKSIRTIGALTIDVRDLFFSSSIFSIESDLKAYGYDLILCNTGDDIEQKKKYFKILLGKKVDGIILIGSVFREKRDNSHIMEAACRLPVVMVNGYVKGENIYCILSDDSKAMEDITLHLISNSRKNLAYIYDVDTYSSMEKLKGFKKAAQSNKRILILKAPKKGMDGGFLAVRSLLESKAPFDAIVCSDDIVASGALKGVLQAGVRVPQDCAVTGFDNSMVSRCTIPELTTVDSKIEYMSSLSVKYMLDALTGNKVPQKTVIQPEIIFRETSM